MSESVTLAPVLDAALPRRGRGRPKKYDLPRRDRVRIGAAIAEQLEPLRSMKDVAAELGLNEKQAFEIQNEALYKISEYIKKCAAQSAPTQEPKSCSTKLMSA